MGSSFGILPDVSTTGRGGALPAAAAAASITIPHSLALGLLAFGPLAATADVGALALWSAALPAALTALVAGRAGVIHAPTTVVALLYGTVLASLAPLARDLHLGAPHLLAIAGATGALCFAFQWLLGALRLASLARFLPISVMQGFAAGVGLAMVASQLRTGFGQGAWAWDAALLRHAGVALAVVAVAVLVQRRWRRFPGLLPGVALVAVAATLAGLPLQPAATGTLFALPPVPDWDGVPWGEVLRVQGVQLVSLALLTAIVNSLDIVVYNQELDLDHGLGGDPNAALRRESLVGVLCALVGLIPASTSASRSRMALAIERQPSLAPGRLHAVLLLAVAASGHLWLSSLPMACLAGGLLLAGFNQVPASLWSARFARTATAVWLQGWIVALVFAVAGGVGALVTGLVVATFVLLHASASTALRRVLLDGQLRSRRLRQAAAEAWLAPRMHTVAVLELQGVLSFGVAAYLAEQVRKAVLPRHRRVILDGARVAAWDATALARLVALGRDLGRSGAVMVVAGLDRRSAETVKASLAVFPDLDRALEWAEDEMLQEAQQQTQALVLVTDALGELGDGLHPAGHAALVCLLVTQDLPPWTPVFAAGATDTDLAIVSSGRITMSTAWPPSTGLRLATVGRGMACGEMAFLNGRPRTACAGTEAAAATLLRLPRERFDAWALAHPADALRFMANLAQIGTRRLAATTRQLRAVLE